MTSISLKRMNGLGNVFLIYDVRRQNYNNLTVENIKLLSSKENLETKGCDQFIVIMPPNSDEVDIAIKIFNADGSEVEACGNATRCIAWLFYQETCKKDNIKITTAAGLLEAKIENQHTFEVKVNMGTPQLSWQDIPLAHEVDELNLPISKGDFKNAVAVGIGNTHMVYFCDDDISQMEIDEIGAEMEKHPLYPNYCNVEFANVINDEEINLRVFERGVGETSACGTGACATLVAACQKGYTRNFAKISLPGGDLKIEWDRGNSNQVFMTGKVEFEKDLKVEIA